MTAPTPTTEAALRDILNREPVELEDGVTPERVIALALTTIDLGYRVHPENGRASMLAVEADWIMQQWAKTEAWAKDEQAKRHAAEDKLVEARSRAAFAEADRDRLSAELATARAEGEALRAERDEVAAQASEVAARWMRERAAEAAHSAQHMPFGRERHTLNDAARATEAPPPPSRTGGGRCVS